MIRVTLVLAAMLVASQAHAQFTNPFKKADAPAGGQADATAAAPDGVAQDALVRRFVTAQTQSLKAQTAFAKAFGLADQVQLLEAEQLALSSGTLDVKGMNKVRSVTADAQAAIDARQAEEPALSAEAKAHYAEGLVALLLAVNETRLLTTEASAFAKGMQNGNKLQLAMMARKLAVGAWVAKETPGYAKGLYTSSKAAFTFAKRSKVKIPPNADSMLDSLGPVAAK